jgi:SAM-dependent methyltransferase
VPDAPSSEPELEVNVVIEDFPPSIDVSLEETPAPPQLSGAPAPRPPRPAPNGDAAPSSPEASSPEASSPEASSPDAAHEPTGKRAKAPPNKRKRPPPPSSRSSDKLKLDLTTPPARKWWEEMFSEEFLRAIPILSPRQLEREVNFIDEALAVNRGGRILDLACGAGQHAVELATRGYDLVGFDLSQSQLDWAGGLAQERNQRLQFTYGDMREITYNEAFDAVYSWNTSFGFFEEEKNVDVLSRIFRALRPGGRFLLDVINRDFVVAQQPGQTWFEGDGCVCIDDVSIDFITKAHADAHERQEPRVHLLRAHLRPARARQDATRRRLQGPQRQRPPRNARRLLRRDVPAHHHPGVEARLRAQRSLRAGDVAPGNTPRTITRRWAWLADESRRLGSGPRERVPPRGIARGSGLD